MKGDIYQFELNNKDHQKFSLNDYKGKVLMIVNVSKGPLNHQDKKLENLYKKYKDMGLSVIGIPSGNFNHQDNQNSKEYSFVTTEEISVRGEEMHPLYDFLTHEAPDAVEQFYGIAKKAFLSVKLDKGEMTDVVWNYEKFLVSKDGEIVQRFSPEIEADDARISKAIEVQMMA